MKNEWEATPWPPDVRACATGDVLPVAWFVFWTVLGAVMMMIALGMWAVEIVGHRSGGQARRIVG